MTPARRLLDERRRQVLVAIIAEYVESAEPVGSALDRAPPRPRTVSPATIRNVMADLEEHGLSHPAPHLGRPRARPTRRIASTWITLGGMPWADRATRGRSRAETPPHRRAASSALMAETPAQLSRART